MKRNSFYLTEGVKLSSLSERNESVKLQPTPSFYPFAYTTPSANRNLGFKLGFAPLCSLLHFVSNDIPDEQLTVYYAMLFVLHKI